MMQGGGLRSNQLPQSWLCLFCAGAGKILLSSCDKSQPLCRMGTGGQLLYSSSGGRQPSIMTKLWGMEVTQICNWSPMAGMTCCWVLQLITSSSCGCCAIALQGHEVPSLGGCAGAAQWWDTSYGAIIGKLLVSFLMRKSLCAFPIGPSCSQSQEGAFGFWDMLSFEAIRTGISFYFPAAPPCNSS